MKSFTVQSESGAARACRLELGHGVTLTPIFMPVGTAATVKGLSSSDALAGTGCRMLLSNTYHLEQRPGSEVVRANGGVHEFMGYTPPHSARTASTTLPEPTPGTNILTDSGGFQMVSLVALSKVTEEGVWFQSPIDGSTSLLTPEASVQAQHNIGADVVMALDDVVHSCAPDAARFVEATERTLRWLDRCLDAHEPRKHVQALFAIVQGGLDVSPGGLRDRCLAGFRARDVRIPGYAIGGLAGGESKDAFWKVVLHCTKQLPRDKPRYLMGVGDPKDLVVCVGLGVDMFDCVFPTRTARFGTAFTRFGSLNIKHASCASDLSPIEAGCECEVCVGTGTDPNARAGEFARKPYSRALLHAMFKDAARSSLAGSLVSLHNISYMLRLSAQMRVAVVRGDYGSFCREFFRDMYKAAGSGDADADADAWRKRVPSWVVDALRAVGIEL